MSSLGTSGLECCLYNPHDVLQFLNASRAPLGFFVMNLEIFYANESVSFLSTLVFRYVEYEKEELRNRLQVIHGT